MTANMNIQRQHLSFEPGNVGYRWVELDPDNNAADALILRMVEESLGGGPFAFADEWVEVRVVSDMTERLNQGRGHIHGIATERYRITIDSEETP